MATIIISRADGGVSIGPFTGDPDIAFASWVRQAHIHELPATFRVVSTGVSLPSGRMFRTAWTDANPGAQVDVDMNKARAIHMNRIRAARDDELARSDVELARAEDAGDTVQVARLRDKRKALRDIPQTFDLTAATKPDELVQLWPDELQRG